MRKAFIASAGVKNFLYIVSEINKSKDGGLSKGKRLIQDPRESCVVLIIHNFQHKVGSEAIDCRNIAPDKFVQSLAFVKKSTHDKTSLERRELTCRLSRTVSKCDLANTLVSTTVISKILHLQDVISLFVRFVPYCTPKSEHVLFLPIKAATELLKVARRRGKL